RSRRLVIPELVARSARREPEAPALAFEGETRSFGALDDRAQRLAAALAARGVGPGAKVAILMYNRIEFVESFLAIQLLGACAVPVNFRLSREEAEYVLADSGSLLAIADPELASLAGELPTLLVGEEYERALAAAPVEPPPVAVDDEDLAFLMYTSGTTGRPKGAMLSHQNLVCNTTNWLYEVGARRGDVWLSGLPLFHIGGLNGVLPFLHLGSLAVIEPSGGFSAERSIARFVEHGVTMCFFVPTQWQEICASPEVERIDRERLRVAMWGASQAPLPTLELMSRTFPAVEIVSAFGQTEMSSNTCFLKGEDSIRKMGSVGRPALGVEARIVDEDGADVSRGEVGEIVYRGPTVMHGYHGKPEATAEAFSGGWFHSGDLVREDSEGFVYVVDRLKDMLISGGENVYPAEVERALVTHPGVAEVAVIGVPHERWVETPLAVVVREPGAEVGEEELIELCRERLAGYKKPSAVVFVDELPRNASGKVLKRALRERYAAAAS
ncbi:MAG TPA: long-chain fatty acid--CoA ligase, partial [Solirubrobacterales bacterium]|nr:long-chain fatty acid--CoA ligase [Solirubrobacterales bacterium]